VTQLYLYDDAAARSFEPFSLTRPVSELRAGTELIRHRWERVARLSTTGFLGAPHLSDFEEIGAPPATCGDSDLPPGSIVASSRCALKLDQKLDPKAQVWICDGRVAAVRVGVGTSAAQFSDGSLELGDLNAATGKSVRANLSGRWMGAAWDLIAALPEQLAEDIGFLSSTLKLEKPNDVQVIGAHPIYCERGAVIEPWVVLDVTGGPILIRSDATISSFSRISGPCYIGERVTIIGDRVSTCSIGEVSKIRGEISHSIVLGHSNKGHTGFVGHSYIGRWVNLGAGTTTSDLKNTYGTVHVDTAAGRQDTRQQFLGTLFGDHVKTGIGTMLTTGTIMGAGASIFGTMQPPKRVLPFAWGDGQQPDRYDVEKFLVVAERMMARRHVELGERARRALKAAYDEAASL
jgi:UDP-N-acetylglucosamine diphosphorylase/glucosamine-1-phosphate N-acetyltransferase